MTAAERLSGNGVPFADMVTGNNAAIEQGLRQGFAPNADSSAVSAAAHDLLQDAQKRGRAALTAAYAPFDATKGGIYLERGPVKQSLQEAYNGLPPAHREILPVKVSEIINGTGPNVIADARPHSPASRALMVMRDAPNKGSEAAPIAERPPLTTTRLEHRSRRAIRPRAMRARIRSSSGSPSIRAV